MSKGKISIIKVMSIHPIWGNFFGKKDFKIRDYLHNVPIFSDLNEKEFRILERYMFIRKFLTNEYVFHQNEPGAGMYIVINGNIKIRLEKDIKHISDLVVLGCNDFFGEMALLDESPRSAAALCVSDNAELISFFRSDLLKIIQEYPTIACKILWSIGEVVSTRLRKSNEIINSLPVES